MFCKNCGNEMKDGAKFCDKCGTTIEQSKFSFETGAVAAENKHPKSNIKKYIICFAVIALVLIFILIKCSRSSAEPAIRINSISFNSYTNDIEYKFENISDKDIAYITFEKYFYDKMGGALKLSSFSDDDDYDLKLNYTGPLYKDGTDSAYWEYCFEIPTGAAVVYPKYITVTFIDDKEITFENDFYWESNDFYGGKLKDK